MNNNVISINFPEYQAVNDQTCITGEITPPCLTPLEIEKLSDT